MPSESGKFSYDIPWQEVAKAAAFCAALSLGLAYLAATHPGIARYFLMILAALFAILALDLPARRLRKFRVLELSEDSVFMSIPGLRTGRAYIECSKIIRLSEGTIRGQTVLRVITKEKELEICSSYFEGSDDYSLVRSFICSRSSIELTSEADSRTALVRGWREAPPPLLHWTEPEDWPRYRASLVAAQPLSLRLGKTLWFATRCLAIIIAPWLILLFTGMGAAPFVGYFALALAVTAFFTLLHWLYRAHPTRISEIVVRNDHVTFYSGLQMASIKYDRFTGWKILQRQFEGRPLFILLLQRSNFITAHVLPDADTRDKFGKILESQNVPANPNLQPSWE